MPTPTSLQARKHQAELAELAARGAAVTAKQLEQKAPWSTVLTTWAAYQLAAVDISADKMAGWLDGPVQTLATAYSGVSSYGFPISEPLITTIDKVIPAPVDPLPEAWWDDAAAFMRQAEQLIASEIRDAARSAAQAEMVAQGHDDYIRLLNPPSCKRCVPLAGRIYKWDYAFDRHPDCDCIHVPVANLDSAKAEGFVLDARELFEAGQIMGLSRADSDAIADGADINEVVNAVRGTSQPGITSALTAEVFGRSVKATTAQTTKRALWRKQNPTRMVRLRPEAIYKFAKDPADARRLLALYGYLKPST